MFKAGTASRCVCQALFRHGRTTVKYLAEDCDTTISTVRHVLNRLESEGFAHRVYRSDVDYDVEVTVSLFKQDDAQDTYAHHEGSIQGRRRTLPVVEENTP